MPRTQQSEESKVLSYFRTAPLAAVGVVLGLVKEVVKEREEAPVPRKKHKKAKAPVAVPVVPSKKKSHKKKAAKPVADAAVEDFGGGEV